MTLNPANIFFIALAAWALLFVAHIGGCFANRVGIPRIVGKLGGGILLGAALLKRVWPEAQAWLIPLLPSPGSLSPTLPILGCCGAIVVLMVILRD